MQSFKRLISLILVFQLCVACNGGGGSSGVVSSPSSSSNGGSGSGSGGSGGGGGTLNIQGTIGKVFNSVSEILLSSAVAQDGQMEVFDVSDPNSPKSLGLFDVEDESAGYSVDLPAEDAQGKLLKLSYLGKVGVREMIVNVDPSDSSVRPEIMNADNHIKSKILEAQLQQEVASIGFATVEELRVRFKDLDAKKAEIDDDLADFGDVETIKSIIEDPEKGKDLTNVIAQARSFKDQGNEQAVLEAQAKAFEVASNVREDKFGGPKFVCGPTKAKFFFRGEGAYQLKAIGLTIEVLKQWNGADGIDWGQLSSSVQINQIFSDIVSKLQYMSKDIYEGKLLGAQVRIIDMNGKEEDRTCDLYSHQPKEGENESNSVYSMDVTGIINVNFESVTNELEGRQLLEDALNASVDQYKIQLDSLGLEDSLRNLFWDMEVTKAKMLFEARLKELSEYLNLAADKILQMDASPLFEVDFQGAEDFDGPYGKLKDALGAVFMQLKRDFTLIRDAKLRVGQEPLQEGIALEQILDEQMKEAEKFFLTRVEELKEYLATAKYAQKYAFPLDMMRELDLAEDIPLRDRQFKLYDIFRVTIEQGKAKIWDGVNAGEFDDLMAQKLLLSQVQVLEGAFNERIDAYASAALKPEYPRIDLSQMRSLNCSNFGNSEELMKVLEEIMNQTYQPFVEFAKESGLNDEEIYSQIDELKMTHENKYFMCSLYYSIPK